jgi:hypothetical protein
MRVMVAGTIRYSVGNENNPGDPWGRSELVITPGGNARLDHHFSRVHRIAAWRGQVDPDALAVVWAGLDLAGFPAEPMSQFVAGATLRRLAVQSDGIERRAILDWRNALELPGYAEAFDVLDGVIRQLSGGDVSYPTKQQIIVRNVEAILLAGDPDR